MVSGTEIGVDAMDTSPKRKEWWKAVDSLHLVTLRKTAFVLISTSASWHVLASVCGDGFSVAATEQTPLVLTWQLRTWACPHSVPAWLHCHSDDPWEQCFKGGRRWCESSRRPGWAVLLALWLSVPWHRFPHGLEERGCSQQRIVLLLSVEEDPLCNYK